jgi:hypothetical protein
MGGKIKPPIALYQDGQGDFYPTFDTLFFVGLGPLRWKFS